MKHSFVLFSASTAILFRCMYGAEKRVTVWFDLSKDRPYHTYSFKEFKQEMSTVPHQLALAEINWQADKLIKISFSTSSLSTTIKRQYFDNNYFTVDNDTVVSKELMALFNCPKEFIFKKGKYPVMKNIDHDVLEVLFY